MIRTSTFIATVAMSLALSACGGKGDDTYVVDGLDTVVELLGEGTDTVQSTVDHALGANVENLVLVGYGAVTGVAGAAGPGPDDDEHRSARGPVRRARVEPPGSMSAGRSCRAS